MQSLSLSLSLGLKDLRIAGSMRFNVSLVTLVGFRDKRVSSHTYMRHRREFDGGETADINFKDYR